MGEIGCGSLSEPKRIKGANKPRGPTRGGGSYVARLNFKTSHVSVYKYLLLIVTFPVTVAIWPKEVVSYRDFILHAVATFWALSLVGIYPGRTSAK